MTNPAEIETVIKFHLAGLSSTNGHHEFEQLSRQYARARVCSNILPATGPVAAGGDAGRDFETFASYLSDGLGPHGAFVGAISEGPIAFICTLQETGLPSKIRSDVDKIMQSGQRPAKVVAFLAHDLPIAHRNTLKKEVAERYDVDLEVFDAFALAQELAKPDLFWIAAEYLRIPAAVAPDPSEDAQDASEVQDGEDQPGWYLKDRDRWHEIGEARHTPGDLLDLTDGLRHAAFEPTARPDLDFWLALLEPLTSAEAPFVRQRARYEFVVSTLRGHGKLSPADEILRNYFEEAFPSEDISSLMDAQILVSYAIGAYRFAVTDLSGEYLRQLQRAVRSDCERLLNEGPPPTQRARLLEVEGSVCLQPDPERLETAQDPLPMNELNQEEARAAILDRGMAELDLVDSDRALDAWGELAHLLDDVPLMPVDSLSQLLVILTPRFVDDERWRPIVDSVDAQVRRTIGNAAAAGRARDRAMALLSAGELVSAVAELHRAKADWWSGDTLRGALLALLILANVYSRLELPQAAKQHALAAVGAAGASDDSDLLDLVPRGLAIAADAEFQSGAWCSATELYELALVAESAYSPGGVDLDSEGWGAAFTHLGMITFAARDLAPSFDKRLAEVLARIDSVEILAEREKAAPRSEDEWLATAAGHFTGVPFNDVGETRSIRFQALGVTWIITSQNEYRDVRAAERLAAAAQIISVELARKDLALLPGTLRIQVATEIDPRSLHERIEHVVGEEGPYWSIVLRTAEKVSDLDPAEVQLELMTVLSIMLLDCSLLPQDRFNEILEEAGEAGLASKLLTARPFDDLAEVIPEPRFDESARPEIEASLGMAQLPPVEHEELSWQEGPGPTYSRTTAEEMLTNRYELLPTTLRLTLPRVKQDIRVLGVMGQLRDRGWLDWHVLTAIHGVVLNQRLAHFGLHGPPESTEIRKRATDLAFAEEDEDWPEARLDELSFDRLNQQRQISMLSFIKHWDLELHQRVLDPDALEQFVATRYAYWEDDIEHEDPFPELL